MKKILFLPDDYKGVVNRDNPSFEVLEKGNCISRFNGIGDGFNLEYDESSGFVFYALLNKPQQGEIEAFGVGSSFEISFTTVYGCGVVCFKFGAKPWGEVNFEPRLYNCPLLYPNLDDYSEGGLTLNVILVDPSKNGEIKSIRTIGLGHEFSIKFIEWCINQYKTKPLDFTKEKYFRDVDMIRHNYTSNELNSMALFRWKLNNDGEGNERSAINRADGR